MKDIAKLTDGLDQTVLVLKGAITALILAAALTATVCLLGLIVAGTFGILHHGDDFDFHLGGGRGVDSDLIVLPGALLR